MCRHNHTGMQECRNRLLQGCTQELPCFWCHPVTFKVTVVDKCSLNFALKGCCPGGSTRLRGGQPGQAMLSVLLRCSGPCLGLWEQHRSNRNPGCCRASSGPLHITPKLCPGRLPQPTTDTPEQEHRRQAHRHHSFPPSNTSCPNVVIISGSIASPDSSFQMQTNLVSVDKVGRRACICAA